MIYGNLIHNIFVSFFICFSKMLDVWKCVCLLLVCFVFKIVIFIAFIGFGVIFCIYEHILKVFYIFGKNVQKWEQFSYELFDCDLLWFVVICCPPSPSLASVKVPYGGKNMEKNNIHTDLYDSYEKVQKMYYNDYVV